MSVITSYDCTFIKAVSVRPAHPALPTASRATHPTSSTDQEYGQEYGQESGQESPGKCAESSAGLELDWIELQTKVGTPMQRS